MSAAALSPCKWSCTRPRSARAFSSSFAPPDCALSPSEPHNSATTTPSAQVFFRPGRCCSTPVSRVFFGVRTRLRRRRAPPGQQTDGFVGAGAIGVGDHRGIVFFLSSRGRGVWHGLAMRCVQVPAPQVPAGLRVRTLLPTGQPAEVRARAPCLRRQQRDQAAERAPPFPARGRRELARLRGRHAPPRPRLRLRWRHLHPPAQPTPAPAGPRPRQVRALQVPGGSGSFCVHGGAQRAAGDGRVHRQRDAERRAQLHQHWTLGGARLPRRLRHRVRPGAVRQRADAVQELRRRAHREAGDQRRLRVRVLDRDGRVWRCLWPRDARHQPFLEVRYRRRRREAQRRSVGGPCDRSIKSCQVTDVKKRKKKIHEVLKTKWRARIILNVHRYDGGLICSRFYI